MAEHESEVYCRGCHKRMFGAGAVTRAAGASAEAPQVVNARDMPTYISRNPAAEYEPPALPQRAESSITTAVPAAPKTPPRQQMTGQVRKADISPSSVFSSGRRRVSIQPTRDMCPRCSKPIYHAEKVVGPGGPWHKGCFKCRNCNCALSSTILTEHDGEAYCRTCYTKLFSLRGYNVGGSLEPTQSRQQSPIRSRGSSFESIPPPVVPSYRSSAVSPSRRTSNYASEPRTPPSPANSPFVSAAAAAASAAVSAHSGRPATPLSSGTVSSRPVSSRGLSPGTTAYGRAYKPKVFGFGGVPPDICPRCSKTIYHAELGMAAGRKYHKACIRCRSCNTSIGSLQITEHDGDIFCKQCYARNYGPKGFRQSIGPHLNEYQ
ncbi:hypothetical protein GGI15_003126 [Coemansia interrupta]|uniref:LIM zinc-binding domain-containing protein n=1 Tax=Coemansia interrupta TaxID=1126814 RepID=A0A9W8HEE3_9FUNG|nr:hypothetical protein GGI15_003126 [Coemansia interrupta]